MLDAGLKPGSIAPFDAPTSGARRARSAPARSAAPTAEAVGAVVVRVLPRLTRHLVAKMHEAPQAHGLTWPQFRVLGYLNERDYRASELADALEVGRSTLTTIGDGLVRRGLVERIRDLPNDRRGVLMRLTVEGQSLHAMLRAHAVAGVASLMAPADDAERIGLAIGLEAVERGLCAELAAHTTEAP